ncbi:hypothetical protein [Sulfitobacter sp. R18_1]|uniref:hypothetical protein n=1 Tax=Sulfitobacter sp. R18_1 TaxID=2821104 RepID=UPI001ADD3B0A|nr:hypothetical protein [Sulfitobacter sp. R18_1]MBO9428343.1 hypothetical protein [Sulfitobacter sp. R18_1]
MLPIVPGSEKIDRDEVLPSAGSYWRFKGELNENGKFSRWDVPEHGLVLLVKEVRVVDGDIHTIVMKSHPTWENGNAFTIRILADEFFENWALEPEWESIREHEIAEVQSRINGITSRIQSGPEEETLQLLIAEQREKREEKDDKAATKSTEGSANVPAALLPSGDVLATQKKIETGLDLANAQAAFIQGQTKEIQSEMKLLVGFQTEKSEQALASVSDAQSQAEGLLKNVRTMRLFLGEDSATHTLVTGKGAPKDEPLTLLQQLLYLDEEVFVEGQFADGFDHSAVGDIDTLFRKHPQIIDRMMPYERCVVLARVRRHNRSIDPEAKMTLTEAFELIQERELDTRVFLFIRDGENVHMVMADEQTSSAKRLFPSADEINAIFTSGLHGKREITVKDIEYSYAREKHDDRALHYKRFLLLLWGLHEREGLLGDFMPKGQNWLTETVHNERFRFVHDEEGVLDDGRPSLSEFIKSANENMTEGSRIAVNWNEAIDEYSAPQVYDSTYRKVDPVNQFEIAVLRKADKNKLTAKCLSESRWDPSAKIRNTTVVIQKREKGRPVELNGRTEYPLRPHVAEGVICLDFVDLHDIEYYLNSRAARVQYLRYIHSFAEARKLLSAEKASLDAVARDLLASNPQANESMIKDAIVLWRKWKNWALPETNAHVKAIQKIVAAMLAAQNIRRPELIELQVTGKGEIVEIEPVDPGFIPGFDMGFVVARTLLLGTKGNLTEVSSKTVVRSLTEPGKSSLTVWLRDETPRFAYPSEIRSVRDNLSSDNASAELGKIVDRASRYAKSANPNIIGDSVRTKAFSSIDVETADALMENFYRYVFSDKRDAVPGDIIHHTLGLFALTPKTEGSSSHGTSLFQVNLVVDLTSRLWAQGHSDTVKKWIKRIYRPEGYIRQVANFEDNADKNCGFSIRVSRIDEDAVKGEDYFGGFSNTLDTDEVLSRGLDRVIAEHFNPATFSVLSAKHVEPTEEEIEETRSRILMSPNLKEAAESILKSAK